MDANDTEIHSNRPVPALRFDWTDWLPYLDDQDIPDKQKRELIETLWTVVIGFVDLGWRIDARHEIGGSQFDLKAILETIENHNEREAL